jgi:hypothetical protein
VLTDRHFLYASYETSGLGYALTDHTAQGPQIQSSPRILECIPGRELGGEAAG